MLWPVFPEFRPPAPLSFGVRLINIFQGNPVYQEINAALQSLNVIRNWISANKSLSNYNELIGAVSEVNAKLISAQSAFFTSEERNSALIKRNKELEDTIAQDRKWEQEIQKYKIFVFQSGSVAYIFDDKINEMQRPYYICADGANKREIHILQPLGEGFLLRCNKCNVMIQTEELSHAKLAHVLTNVKRMGYA